MKNGRWSVMLLLLLASRTWAQQAPPSGDGPPATPFASLEICGANASFHAASDAAECKSDPLTGNHDFANFIGFISDPLQNIDPRAVTAIYPLFGSTWVSTAAPFPDAEGQIYGPAMTVALSDRFAFGLNQGGYAYLHLDRTQLARLAALDPQGRFRNVEIGGGHQGFLNVGGFAQYTLVEDVPDQFLLTGGVRWVAPAGSHSIFQGSGPGLMAPYFTVGKEFGDFHVLATAGYQFPFAGSGKIETDVFYANVHLDRRCFGWLYPLVEFNTSYHTRDVNFGVATREGFIDFGNFETEGNILSMAVGLNAVLVKERLEVGAVYTTVLAAERNFDANGLLVKMMIRF